MSPLHLVTKAALGLLAANAAWGAPGAPIPLTMPSATVCVNVGNDDIEVTDSLPFSVPFNLSDGGCSSNGTVTVSLVSGKVRVQNQGAVSGSNCSVDIEASYVDLSFDVPSVGDSTTAVLVYQERVSSSLSTGIVDFLAWAWLGQGYSSSLTASDVFFEPNDLDLQYVSSASLLMLMIPSDSVVFPGVGQQPPYASFRYKTDSSGTFDETYELSTRLPPQPLTAAVPTGVGWLLGGVLLGLGIKVLRRPAVSGLGSR